MKTRTTTGNLDPKQDMSFHLKPKIIHYHRPDWKPGLRNPNQPVRSWC